MARSKSKHNRMRNRIRLAWKKRFKRKKAAAAEAAGKKK
ncbi:MAG: aminopeptidase [Myxococcaceae bacterium]